MAQELLTSFTGDLGGVLLVPSEEGGHFSIRLNDFEIFNRQKYGGFMEIKKLKQMVRDYINPGKSLGHSDDKNKE